MMLYCVFLLAVGFANAIASRNLHPLSDELIQEINNKQSTWQAGRNFEIEEYELFKVLASGLIQSDIPRVYTDIHDEEDEVPEYFDAREAWPECADIIGFIRDQSRCGSCWALSAVEAMSDRICIHSNATRKLLISAQDLLTCSGERGCLGGTSYGPWSFWNMTGIVTGGLYNHTEQGCQSYFLPPCDDHLNNCRDYVDVPECKEICDNSLLQYEDQKTYGQPDIVELNGEKQIQLEILKNGPVEGTMDIYSDFASYKSGIYQHICGELLTGHAIKMIGWGIENDTKYWIVANTWNERWGEKGYFKILRGQNEVSIEGYATAALPDFSRF